MHGDRVGTVDSVLTSSTASAAAVPPTTPETPAVEVSTLWQSGARSQEFYSGGH